MPNQYALQPTQTITAPNGIKITIYTDGNKRFVKLRSVYNSLGYPRSWGNNSLFAMAFKSGNIAYYNKYITGGASYVIEIKDVVPLLEKFCRLTLTIKSNGTLYDEIRDNARMEAERLIEVFNTEVFGKTPTVTVTGNTGKNPTKTQDTIVKSTIQPLFADTPKNETFINIFVSPNGTTLNILQYEQKFWVKGTALLHALGVNSRWDSGTTTEKQKRNLFCRYCYNVKAEMKRLPFGANNPVYLEVRESKKVLASYIGGELTIKHVPWKLKLAQELLDYFSTTVMPELYGDNAPIKKQSSTGQKQSYEAEQEEIQMKDNATNQATLPPVTVADIEDISERADATVKVFGVSKADALRAVTQLKAQEINRDLTPFLELLDGQKK